MGAVCYAWFCDSPLEKRGISSAETEAFANYNAPFVPMVALLCIGTWLWLQLDPEHQLFEERGAATAVTFV